MNEITFTRITLTCLEERLQYLRITGGGGGGVSFLAQRFWKKSVVSSPLELSGRILKYLFHFSSVLGNNA